MQRNHDDSPDSRNASFEKEISSRHAFWELIVFYLIGTPRNAQLAKDITQDFYVRVLERWEQIPFQDGQVKLPFLVRMLKNIYHDHRRSGMASARTDELNLALHLEAPKENTDEKELLNLCLEYFRTKLNPTDCKIMELLTLQGLKYHEISSELNMPLGTVSIRISRIREQLRDRFRA
jgi:RNA polymerase sigma factor (sigma-70 family)